jgi:hypothetical protein
MGLIIGYEFSTRPKVLSELEEIPESKFKQGKSSKKHSNKNSIALIGFGLGAFAGITLAFPIFQNDANFRKAVSSQSAEEAIRATLASPEDLNRTVDIAGRLKANSLNLQAGQLIAHVLVKNPRNITAWRIRYELTEPGSAANEEARKQINFLNPKVPIE